VKALYARETVKIRWAQACATAYVWFSVLDAVCLVYFFIARRKSKIPSGMSSVSGVTYSSFAVVFGAAALALIATATMNVVRDVRGEIVVSKRAFREYFGWGYWMLLACECASVMFLTFSAVEVRLDVVNRRRRRLAYETDLDVVDDAHTPSAPPAMNHTNHT